VPLAVGLIVIGIGATVWGVPWEPIRDITRDLGPGIFTAGILASLVEPFFRHEFARDAFLAAFRYVLPDEFRDEVAKIIRFDFIARKQIWTVQIEKASEGVVRVTTTLERTVTNKTKSKKSIRAWVEAEDYDFQNGPTEVVLCSIEEEDSKTQHVSSTQTKKDHYQDAHTDDLDLLPDKSAKIAAKIIQYRRSNDAIYETFRAPIVNPEIEVFIDEKEFSHSVTFGTHGDVAKSQFRNHYTLAGVYFPGQFMVVRWWPKLSQRRGG
jgi:hypothetical protein